MSRVSREQADQNRADVVKAASTLFRRKGLDGVGIRELMAEIGLTQGGFRGQFGSKDVLAGEACHHAFEGVERVWSAAGEGSAAGRMRRLAEFYFEAKPSGSDCPMATLAGDVARTPIGSPVRKAFTNGLRQLTGMFVGKRSNDKALALFAAMVGAVVLRRASDDDELSDAIESAVMRLVPSTAH